MDSVTAVRFVSRLSKSLGRQLSSTVAFENPNIAALTDYLASELLQLEVADGVASVPASEDEVAQLLAAKLEKLDALDDSSSNGDSEVSEV